MFIPRLHIGIADGNVNHILNEVRLACEKEVQGIYLELSHLSREDRKRVSIETKKICLLTNTRLLLNDLETAAITNADGVILPYGDFQHGRAKDILGEDKVVGGRAHRIDDIAELWEEGMADFIILESYMESGGSTNILGRQTTQTILDDAKIMGYNIPILIAGGIDTENAQEVINMGCYGVQVEQLDHISSILEFLHSNPLR